MPGLLVWPQQLTTPRTTELPAVTSDYFPTVLAAAGIPADVNRPVDGMNLLPLILSNAQERGREIAFQFSSQAALSGDQFKLVWNKGRRRPASDNGRVEFSEWELYDLTADPGETRNLALQFPDRVERMKQELSAWIRSCEHSDRGGDYAD